MSDTLTKEKIDQLVAAQTAPAIRPRFAVVGPVHYAAVRAAEKFADSDRRRIKREVRKAINRAMIEQRLQNS